ncbi:MAG TPA: 50S ribosomal protein L22 [Armatimonadota bacterium]|nr:50S ribosomal protein L22 [Armatimonadota bacterium]
MEVRAVARFVPMAPRKVRSIIDLVRGKDVEEAVAILQYLPNAGATPILKVLNSAVANAEHNNSLHRNQLQVQACFVDGGPAGHGRIRVQPRARGQRYLIRKRMSHITVIVGEKPQPLGRSVAAKG